MPAWICTSARDLSDYFYRELPGCTWIILGSAYRPGYSTCRKLRKQCHQVRHSEIDVMDTGYNSEEIDKLIRDMLNPCSLNLVRHRKCKRHFGILLKRNRSVFRWWKYPWKKDETDYPSWKERSVKSSELGNLTSSQGDKDQSHTLWPLRNYRYGVDAFLIGDYPRINKSV
jgi:hypothetical protein